jgi:hypothetical protein
MPAHRITWTGTPAPDPLSKLTHAYALFGAKPLPLNFSQRIMGLNEVSAGVRLLALRDSHPEARRIDNPGPGG